MIYRAAGLPGRRAFCAVNIKELNLPIPSQQVDRIIESLGFRYHDIDLLALARSCVGQSAYERGVSPDLAPAKVDCSTFTKYLYAVRGIWLPRYAVQQSETGFEIPLDSRLQLGDLLFSPGKFAFSRRANGSPKIGHVGFATGQGSVIHASCWRGQVSEVPADKYMTLRHGVTMVRRLIADPENTLTYSWPSELGIETSDDVRWLILTRLK